VKNHVGLPKFIGLHTDVKKYWHAIRRANL